ncbi:MAG: methylenetetrahydrofolate reductase [NAD(P)H] [Pseudomonadales bacterium]|nr:methylenetetrahydrofolate reductase [NAD(P)H] [Pseudomonadales bacterium]
MNPQEKHPKHFSCEFSAPKSDAAIEKLNLVHQRLQKLKPHFFSVTYGAGGSTKDGTKQAVLNIQGSGSAVAPHLSFGGDDPEKIETLLNDYKEAGIKRVVALRGDVPSGIGASVKMTFANELVKFIREKTGDHFHIEVAAYPEIHPDSKDVTSDLGYFKQKVDAGANSAITQYFYNPEAYFRFINACAQLQIDIPIVPGIMPLTNFKTLVRFSDNCGADIPRWIRLNLETYQDDPVSLKSFGEEVVTRLCEQLLAGGAPGLHFYTLNQSVPTLKLWHNLGID